jgi:cytidylate kinase
LLGVHPPFLDLVRQTAETILRLAALGNVILLGRGANVITSKLDYVLHVRLVGSIEKRAEHIRKSRQLSREAALECIRLEDRGRKRYLKKYFHQDIEDPLLYHVTINTDLFGCEQTAEMIGNVVLSGSLPHPAARHVATNMNS